MRKLYRMTSKDTVYYKDKNGDKQKAITGSSCYGFSRYVYKDNPKDEIKTITDLKRIFCCTDVKGRKYISPWDYCKNNFFHNRIYEIDFVCRETETKYLEVNFSMTLDRLMRELSADEMIQYLKDNGLNVCPMGGVIK